MQKETDTKTENTMYYYFQRFHDSSKKAWQYIAFFRACLVTILKALSYIFRQDLENATDYGLAVATSLATVLNRTFQTRIASSSSTSFDKCPQFVSKEKRQKFLGKASKKAIRRQHHNFELKQYLQIKYCHHSMELIWGVAPQAYQCTRNNINRTKALAVRMSACASLYSTVLRFVHFVFARSGVEGTLFLEMLQ